MVDAPLVPAAVLSFWLEVMMPAFLKYQAVTFIFSKPMSRKVNQHGVVRRKLINVKLNLVAGQEQKECHHTDRLLVTLPHWAPAVF